jgi:two-component system OmpR family sensor kinase
MTVTVVALGGALLIVGRAVNASQQGQFDGALLAEAREEAREASLLGGDHLDISDQPGPAPDDIGHLTKYGVIYDRSGRSLASTPTFHGGVPALGLIWHPPESAFDFFAGGEHVRGMLVPIPGHPGKSLLLAAPRFDLDRDAMFLNRAILLGLAGAGLWAGIVSAWAVRRLTRGQAAIASVARQVAGGDLSARIVEQASDWETLQLARDVNRMIDRLAELLSAHQEFIALAAHELRTPLTTLYGELSQALRRSRDIEGYRLAINAAIGSARQLKTLAEDLLTLAKVGASSEEPPVEVKTRTIVEDTALTVAAEASEHAIAVRVEGECRAFSGRPNDLKRLFRNLLENAIRHSPKGGKVDATLTEESGWALVEVSDQGCGVPEKDRQRIFEPFYRGPRETADDIPGVGLGLAIARKIARAHGGDVILGPARERGAQFVVRLPYRQ